MTQYFYTALLDVLSYRFRLDRDVKSGGFSFKEDLERSLSIFDKVNTAIFSVQAISDTIIVTCNRHNDFLEFLKILKSVFVSFLRTGLFIRGGVAYSRHFQSGRITYSHAIAKAYEIESELSIYPRIVIDDNIIQMYASGTDLPGIFNQDLLIQHNGVTFLNVIDDENWKEIYGLASAMYASDNSLIKGNESAFQKHLWFEQFVLNSKFAIDQERKSYVEKMTYI